MSLSGSQTGRTAKDKFQPISLAPEPVHDTTATSSRCRPAQVRREFRQDYRNPIVPRVSAGDSAASSRQNIDRLHTDRPRGRALKPTRTW
jgi:hypothetical protein